MVYPGEPATRVTFAQMQHTDMPMLTSSAADAVVAAASCASRDADCIALDRALIAGAASGLASTRQPASSGEREPTSARMHTISSAARRPCAMQELMLQMLLGATAATNLVNTRLVMFQSYSGIIL